MRRDIRTLSSISGNEALGNNGSDQRSSSVTTGRATAQRLGRGVVTVVPMAINLPNASTRFPRVLLLARDGLTADSEAQAERVRSIAVGGSGLESVH